MQFAKHLETFGLLLHYLKHIELLNLSGEYKYINNRPHSDKKCPHTGVNKEQPLFIYFYQVITRLKYLIR